jgi:hypothetical protein
MELQRFYAHLLRGWNVFVALGASEMVSRGERSRKKAGGRGAACHPIANRPAPYEGPAQSLSTCPARDR